MKRASEKDIRKLIELIKDKLSTLSKVAFSGKYSDLSEKATAADVGALPVTGGTLANSIEKILMIERSTKGDILIEYKNSEKIIGALGYNIYSQLVSTNQGGVIKRVVIDGDDIGNCIVNGKKLSEWLS